MKHDKKILVYLFGSLGDSVVAIPAFRAVRRHFPDAEIVLLQNFQTGGGLVRASEVIPGRLVDRHLSYNSRLGIAGKAIGFYRLLRLLRKECFDAAAYLVISERAASAVNRDRYFFRACGIRSLYGFHPLSAAELYPTEADGRPAMTDHEATRKLRRLEMDGIASDADDDLKMPLIEFSASDTAPIDSWLRSRQIDPARKLIAIAPGCKTPANTWPLENFIELGRRLMAVEDCEIIVVGGKAEFDIGEQMVAAWGRGANAAGAFSVHESGALLSKCSLYIGLDTGTTHLAAAAGAKCFAIYGERNNPGQWFPIGDGHRILFHRVPCAGCRLEECSVPGHPCMTGVTVESAWSNLSKFITSDLPRSGVETAVVAV